MSTDKNKYFDGHCPFEEVWERIQLKTDIKSYTDLANIIGKTQQNVSTYKKRNQFPYGWAFPIASTYNLSTDWILTGSNKENITNDNFLLQLEDWAKETSGNDNIQWLKNQIDQTFPMFRDWRIRKEEKEHSGNISDDEENGLASVMSQQQK